MIFERRSTHGAWSAAIGLAVLGSVILGASAGMAAPQNRAISYWNFDENGGTVAGDSTGGRPGIVRGATWAPGQSGSALSFDGVSNRVELGALGLSHSQQPFTIAAWINPSTLGTSTQMVVANGGAYLYPAETGTFMVYLAVTDEAGPGSLALEVGSQQRWGVRQLTAPVLTAGEWALVVVTYDGSRNRSGIKIYLNGVELATQNRGDAAFGPEPVSRDRWNVGAETSPGARYVFNGLIDEVKILNWALSPEAVQSAGAAEVTVTAAAGPGGAISPAGVQAYPFGSRPVYGLTPNPGYCVADVLVDGTSVGGARSYTFDSLTSSHTITAVFGTACTATTTLQPSPGPNNGTDDGSADAGKDTWIRNAGTVTGAEPMFYLWNISCNQYRGRGLLRFNVDGLPTDGIRSAKVQVYARAYFNGSGWPWPAGTQQVSVREILSDWNETAVTYATHPTYGPPLDIKSITTRGVSGVEFEGYLTFDITDLYRGWANGTVANHGVMFSLETSVCQNGDEFTIVTSDWTGAPGWPGSEARPKLIVVHDSNPETHAIEATAGPGGTIAPSDLVTVTRGENQTFTITPEAGWLVADVRVDGVSVGPVTSHTFADVDANHTIEAVFVREASVALSGLSLVYTGQPQGATVATTPPGLATAVTYNSSAAVPTDAGSYLVVVRVTAPGYTGMATATLTIAKAVPAITWSRPADITAGTPLSTVQLNASANVPGTLVYTPPIGTVLPVGANQVLTVAFTPTDQANHEPATATVSITVSAASTPGRMHGAGFIDEGGLRYEFGFSLVDTTSGGGGGALVLSIQGRGPGRQGTQRDAFAATHIESVVFTDTPGGSPGRPRTLTTDTVVARGRGRWNGVVGYTFEARAIDGGEGRGAHDLWAVTVRDPLGAVVASVSGTPTGGNIQSLRIGR